MPKILTPSEVLQFRQRLVDLALQAFAEHGLQGISLRALAAEAGCSRTTPYRYFKNKADILAAVRQSGFQRMADATESAAESERDPDNKLLVLARAYLRFAVEWPDAYRVMFEVNQVNEQRYPQLVEQIKRTQQPMISAVNEAIRAGSIEGDPVNIVHVLWAGLHGLIALHLSNKLHLGRDIDELAEVMIHSLSRAIATRPSKQPAARRIHKPVKL
ncbi:MAG: TetR/AcrR family transcriptional regulator [Gammaproteobacteria bacterium]|nr:TetR/AcrR family transcriptional regulator [Gammaproteobacteria bacterium]